MDDKYDLKHRPHRIEGTLFLFYLRGLLRLKGSERPGGSFALEAAVADIPYGVIRTEYRSCTYGG